MSWPRFTWQVYWNYQGVPAYGTLTTGAYAYPYQLGGGQQNCPALGNTTTERCVIVQWPTMHSAYDQNRGAVRYQSWHGSLLESKRDRSGLDYRRNRFYDPQTGRFTQEDPIGLAGGLNLYGFANGDPVNFSDPFGLHPLAWLVRGLAWLGARWRIIAGAGAVARSRPAQELADDALSATSRLADRVPARIFEIGRQIGNLKAGQQKAVEAIEGAIGRFADRGPTVTIDGVRYLTSGRTRADGAVDAIAVAANGSTTRAIVQIGKDGWELVQNLGRIAAPQ